MKPALNIKSVNKKFDGTVALDNFSQKVQTASITGIIGPNGAGKTTLFNVIPVSYRPIQAVFNTTISSLSACRPTKLPEMVLYVPFSSFG